MDNKEFAEINLQFLSNLTFKGTSPEDLQTMQLYGEVVKKLQQISEGSLDIVDKKPVEN